MKTLLFLCILAGIGAFKKGWRYVILTNLGQHVNEMLAVAVNYYVFLLSRFL